MSDAVATVFREEYGRAVATLVRLLGDITLAEEAVQDAFVVALETWDAPPPNPGGWIVTTARRRAIDCHRRESTREQRHDPCMRPSVSAGRAGPSWPGPTPRADGQ